MTLQPIWLTEDAPVHAFPDVDYAMLQPNGLLAVGGDLSPARLLHAYRRGIFPWFSDAQPILWWAPDPRAVLLPRGIRVSRSLRKTLRKQAFTVTADQAFGAVVKACSEPRGDEPGTWITHSMKQAYQRLYERGLAHSVECWEGRELVGGLYGVAIGKVFFGESMFSRRDNASKVAFTYLVRQLEKWDYQLIDCQVYSNHLASLGAENIDREVFGHLLERGCRAAGQAGPWQLETPADAAHP